MIAIVEFENYDKSVEDAFEIIEAVKIVVKQSKILIKPNLVNQAPPPVTTPWQCCESIIRYIRKHNKSAEIIIAEGTGPSDIETDEVFDILGYRDLAKKYNIELIDLNISPLIQLKNPDFPVFPEMFLPEILFESFIISVPMLKAHSLATVTGSLKNMIGAAPPQYYSGRFGSWKKSVFHERMQESIIDLCRYRKPDLTLMDATIGLKEFHLGGAECDPPVNKIIAGFDPIEVDRKECELLGLDWRSVKHLCVDYF